MGEGRLERLPRRRVGDGVVYVAASPLARLLGLALLDELPPGSALLIPDCRSIHTFGMRFALDVAFLDERGRPLRVVRGMQPRRVVGCRGAVAVLEANAGEIERFVAGAAAGRRARD